MKIKEILELTPQDLRKLTPVHFRGLVQSLAMESGKRVKQLEKSGLKYASNAYNELMETGGSITSKNKDRFELQNEFMRAKKFLQQQTSTVKGTRKSLEDWIEGDESESRTHEKIKTILEHFGESESEIFKRIMGARRTFGYSYIPSEQWEEIAFDIFYMFDLPNNEYLDFDRIGAYLENVSKRIAEEWENRSGWNYDVSPSI